MGKNLFGAVKGNKEKVNLHIPSNGTPKHCGGIEVLAYAKIFAEADVKVLSLLWTEAKADINKVKWKIL